MKKTKYTHKGRIFGITKETEGKEYWADLRKVGKWFETRGRRRFCKAGNSKYFPYDSWRLDIDSIKSI